MPSAATSAGFSSIDSARWGSRPRTCPRAGKRPCDRSASDRASAGDASGADGPDAVLDAAAPAGEERDAEEEKEAGASRAAPDPGQAEAAGHRRETEAAAAPAGADLDRGDTFRGHLRGTPPARCPQFAGGVPRRC